MEKPSSEKISLKVLIVDDEAELRRHLRDILSRLERFEIHIDEASNGLEAVQKASRENYDVLMMDVKMPEMSGLEALAKIKAIEPRTFVVIMTAHSNLQDAVVAIKEGAYDYIEKPVHPEKLLHIIEKSVEARDLVSNLAFSNPIFDDDVDSEFVGTSGKMKEIFNLIYKLCRVETTVLIRGENGTGKELVARAIHFNSSRKQAPFVAVNCGAIPEALMESEFFGHEKGSFTGASERRIGKFQLATQGTLFLDEIGELKPDMQVKLLRVLQERKFVPVGGSREIKSNARIVAATNRNLEKMIQEGTFREDLFYRLNVMPLFLPPLRERKDDILGLTQHFVKKFAKLMGSEIQGVTPEALGALTTYQWPGNIRELENAIERAFIVETSKEIQLKSLPESIRQSSEMKDPRDGHLTGDKTRPQHAAPASGAPLDFELFKEQAEKEFIISALRANHGKINQTVAHANIPKNTLLRKIRRYQINVKDFTE